MDGVSNYAFPLILKKKDFEFRKKLETKMKNNGIEFRRGNAGGGNQLRQPYLKKYARALNLKDFKSRSCSFFWILYRKLSKLKF